MYEPGAVEYVRPAAARFGLPAAVLRARLAAVIATELSLVAINVLLNQWNNRFYNALQERNWDGFVREIGIFTILQKDIDHVSNLAVTKTDGVTTATAGSWRLPSQTRPSCSRTPVSMCYLSVLTSMSAKLPPISTAPAPVSAFMNGAADR